MRCQFRAQSRLYSTKEEERSGKDEDALNEINATHNGTNRTEGQPASSSAEAVVKEEKVEGQHASRRIFGGKEEDLPSQEEGRRSQLSKQFTNLMDNLQSNIFIVGQRLNDLTGYSAIEKLKKEIESHGTCVNGGMFLVEAGFF